jgi:hypothetical protein
VCPFGRINSAKHLYHRDRDPPWRAVPGKTLPQGDMILVLEKAMRASFHSIEKPCISYYNKQELSQL